MKKFLLSLVSIFVLATAAFAVEGPNVGLSGYVVGRSVNDRVGFHGSVAVQRAGSAQSALTDSTTGTAGTTLAAGYGVQTIAIPILLPSIGGDVDVLTSYTPGYAFKLLSASFAVSKPVTTASKAATINLKINSTLVTGGATALTSANCTPLGAVINGSAVTALNTGTASDTISLTATGVTAFVEGEGYLLIKIQNMDTANGASSLVNLTNELRAALVEKGLIKGSQ